MKRKLMMVATIVMLLMAGSAAMAADDGGAGKFDSHAFLGAAIGIGLAAFGGALGQGRTASSALESIARNPGAADKLFVPMVLGLVLIESLVIYALVVEILILYHGKIGV